MTARATWKGLLRISRVTLPIKVFPATESSETLSFNQLHADCKTRIGQKKWCPICAKEVPSAEIVKGFEFEPGKYVLLLPEELDAVQPPSSKCINLVQFAHGPELDPLYIDRTYYLAPDGAAAGEAYAVLSQAMAGLVGIGTLAIYGREYLVAVRPQPAPRHQLRALLLHTLHHAAEIRSFDGLADVPTFLPAKSEALQLAGQVIGALKQPLSLTGFLDAYQVDLRRLIDAKIAGQEIIESDPITTAPVLPLMEALTQSLLAVSTTPKAPAKRKRA